MKEQKLFYWKLKVVLSFVFICVFVELMSIPTFAEEKYDVWVGDVQVTSENKDNIPGKDGGYASYDPDTKTMTLHDLKDVDHSRDWLINSFDDLNVIGTAYLGDSFDTRVGISSYGKLTISGNIKVNSLAEGLYGANGVVVSGEDTIIDVAIAENYNYCVLSDKGDFVIQSGKINISSSWQFNDTYAICANNAIISGGEVNIDTFDGIHCENGSITISGGRNEIHCSINGLYADKVEFSGGESKVSGIETAVKAKSAIDLNNGMSIVYPENAKITFNSILSNHICNTDGFAVETIIVQKGFETTPTPNVVTPTPTIVTPTPTIVTPTPTIVTPTPTTVTPTPNLPTPEIVTAIPLTPSPIIKVTDVPVVTTTPDITKPLTPHKKGDLVTDESDGSKYIITSIKSGSETVSLKQPGKKKGKYVVADKVTIDSITFKVTGVYKGAFKNYSGITSVKLGKYIKSIGESCFEGCSSLKTFTMNSNVTKIGKKAFYGCNSLKNFTMPESVIFLGEKAFMGCTSLNKIYIKTVKLTKNSVGKNVFKNINNTLKIYVPESVKKEYLELLKSKGYSKKKKLSVIKNL